MTNEFIYSLTLPDGGTRSLDAVEEAAYYCEKLWRDGCVDSTYQLSNSNYPTWRRADDILWDLVGGVSTKYRAAVEWAEQNYDQIRPAS